MLLFFLFLRWKETKIKAKISCSFHILIVPARRADFCQNSLVNNYLWFFYNLKSSQKKFKSVKQKSPKKRNHRSQFFWTTSLCKLLIFRLIGLFLVLKSVFLVSPKLATVFFAELIKSDVAVKIFVVTKTVLIFVNFILCFVAMSCYY